MHSRILSQWMAEGRIPSSSKPSKRPLKWEQIGATGPVQFSSTELEAPHSFTTKQAHPWTFMHKLRHRAVALRFLCILRIYMYSKLTGQIAWWKERGFTTTAFRDLYFSALLWRMGWSPLFGFRILDGDRSVWSAKTEVHWVWNLIYTKADYQRRCP